MKNVWNYGKKIMKKTRTGQWIAVSAAVLAFAAIGVEEVSASESTPQGVVVVQDKVAEKQRQALEKAQPLSTWKANTLDQVVQEINLQKTEGLDVYVIQSGDTLSVIAEAAGTTVEELARLNQIKNVDLIYTADLLGGVLKLSENGLQEVQTKGTEQTQTQGSKQEQKTQVNKQVQQTQGSKQEQQTQGSKQEQKTQGNKQVQQTQGNKQVQQTQGSKQEKQTQQVKEQGTKVTPGVVEKTQQGTFITGTIQTPVKPTQPVNPETKEETPESKEETPETTEETPEKETPETTEETPEKETPETTEETPEKETPETTEETPEKETPETTEEEIQEDIEKSGDEKVLEEEILEEDTEKSEVTEEILEQEEEVKVNEEIIENKEIPTENEPVGETWEDYSSRELKPDEIIEPELTELSREVVVNEKGERIETVKYKEVIYDYTMEVKTIYDHTLPEGQEIIEQEGTLGYTTGTRVEVTNLETGEPLDTYGINHVRTYAKPEIKRVGTKPAAPTITVHTVQETFTIKPRVLEQKTNDLYEGERVLSQEGQEGTRVVTYEYHVDKNGQEIPGTRKEVSNEITVQPREEIWFVGTKEENTVVTKRVTSTIPYNIVTRSNPNLPKGEKRVIQEGQDGIKVQEVKEHYHRGELVRVENVGEPQVTLEPRDEIVEVGSQVVEVKEVVEYEDIQFETIETKDPELPVGVKVVDEKGTLGRKKVTYQETYTNGELTGREKVSEVVEQDPKAQKVRIGTKEVADSLGAFHQMQEGQKFKGYKYLYTMENPNYERFLGIKDHLNASFEDLKAAANYNQDRYYEIAKDEDRFNNWEVYEDKDGKEYIYSTPLSDEQVQALNHSIEVVDPALINQEFLKLINEERKRVGVGELTFDEDLYIPTEIRATEQAEEVGHLKSRDLKTGELTPHLRPNGTDYITIFKEHGMRYVGENTMHTHYLGNPYTILSARYIAEHFFEGWKDSEGHYRAMIHPNYSTVAFAVKWVPSDAPEVQDTLHQRLVGVLGLSNPQFNY